MTRIKSEEISLDNYTPEWMTGDPPAKGVKCRWCNRQATTYFRCLPVCENEKCSQYIMVIG